MRLTVMSAMANGLRAPPPDSKLPSRSSVANSRCSSRCLGASRVAWMQHGSRCHFGVQLIDLVDGDTAARGSGDEAFSTAAHRPCVEILAVSLTVVICCPAVQLGLIPDKLGRSSVLVLHGEAEPVPVERGRGPGSALAGSGLSSTVSPLKCGTRRLPDAPVRCVGARWVSCLVALLVGGGSSGVR